MFRDVFDVRSSEQVRCSTNGNFYRPASASCQPAPRISGIVRHNPLRSDDVEDAAGVRPHRVGGSRREHRPLDELELMLSPYVLRRFLEDM